MLEAYLKQLCQRQSLIDGRWGTKFVSLKEDEEGVTSTLATDNGETYQVRSSYVVGSDGGASRVRPQAGISMIGGERYPCPGQQRSRMSNILRSSAHGILLGTFPFQRAS